MKIETSIMPRRDGTVRVSLPSGDVALFKDEGGLMVCDLQDEQAIAYVLGLDGFYPQEDEEDDKQTMLAEAKAMGLAVNGRMSAATIAAKIEAAKAADAN